MNDCSGHLNSLCVIAWVGICGDHENAPLRSPAIGAQVMESHNHGPLWTHGWMCVKVRLPTGHSQPMMEQSR